jgi:hypothetical protein
MDMEGMFCWLLTFDPEGEFIADCLALSVGGNAHVIASTLPGNLLQHEGLVTANDARGLVMAQEDALQQYQSVAL